MAGYVFNLNDYESLENCIENGVYSTILSEPKKNLWGRAHEGTFADYMSMKDGDNVYFFLDRKIYGIGVLKTINLDCKYQNYPNSLLPQIPNFDEIKNKILLGDTVFNINPELFI